MISVFSLATLPTRNVYADPEPEPAPVEQLEEETPAKKDNGASCEKSLGKMAWLVCPATGKIAEAVDWMYDKIRGILEINPVEMKDGTPIYEVWKYARGATNIVFTILLLIVVYSQITGLGISNYGIKKILPKLVVVAILVNLSFVICSLAVDLSNIIGGGLRGLMSSIEDSAMATMQISESDYYTTMSKMYASLAEGALVTTAGVKIAFEVGAIYMLLPVVLGAIVAVASGLITIAMRQAVVMLLIMIAPLAIVAYMLPNTEKWFKKWKDLFVKMLVFYPMFSLLFGASSLAGGAIIASSTDGFGWILGLAVKIFPLFFSWSLMKMSGTFLATVNAKINSLAATPLAASRAWATSRKELTKQKNLAAGNVYSPSLRLRQYLSDRKIAREEETKEYAEVVKNRGLAYAAMRNYKDKDGTPTREGEGAYEMQARNMQYQRTVLRHKNNMNKGLGQLEAVRLHSGAAQKARLDALDTANVDASDYLKIEQARTERIDYDNAVGFHKRMEDAVNAHFDALNVGDAKYKVHDIADRLSATARYNEAAKIMEGDTLNVQYAAATAAHNHDTQMQVITKKMQKYFEMTPPTKDLKVRLKEFSSSGKANDNIDLIISGLREINRRGDTDIVKGIMDDVVDEGLTLGTHASQALASFVMFDVKDNDPFLRRFGKYINLETANVYDENKRKKMLVDIDEYVKGYHIEPDGKVMYAKRPMTELLKGTSFDNIERTAMDNLRDSICKVYGDDDEAAQGKLREVFKATAPQLISAMLKAESGSEAESAVLKFITGYKQKVDKDSGKLIDTWVWDDMSDERKASWNDFHRELYEAFLHGQTPAQLLNFRSGYEKPTRRLLSESFIGSLLRHKDDADFLAKNPWVQQEIDEYGEFFDKYEDLMASGGGKALDEIDYDFAETIATMRFREILGEDTMKRVLLSADRSSAANTTKPFARNWMGINDEEYKAKVLGENYRGGRGRKQPISGKRPRRGNGPTGDSSAPAEGGNAHFTLYDNVRDWMATTGRDPRLKSDVDGYFAESCAELKSLGLDTIANLYTQYYRNHTINSVSDLEACINQLLIDNPEDK